jgi:signal transduction histidine kinase
MNGEVSAKPSVLIVDDHPNNIKVLGAALADNYEISFATSGAEGLELACRCPPDLILLDVMMPGMDGFETCRRLRADLRLRDIPVIFISALEDVADKVRAFQAGGNDYVTKPFQLEEVKARVSTHVALYRARRELRDREGNLRQSLAELGTAHAKLKEMSSQLLQSEKMASIGQLAAGVAHEINNPIGFINSNLGTLKKYINNLLQLLEAYGTLEAVAPAELRQQIEEAKRKVDLEFLREDIVGLIAESVEGAGRVQRIVKALRDFSHPGESEWQEADVHAGLESTLGVAWNEIKYKAEVIRDYGELPSVECLPSQLNQVFLNLLVNAAQAIGERGQITLRTRHEDDWVSIAISDTGSGIAPAIRKRVFDPFFTTKPVGKGTGLGLSLAYGIITKHGGRIDVESELGKGSTFTVRLPVHHIEEQPAC